MFDLVLSPHGRGRAGALVSLHVRPRHQVLNVWVNEKPYCLKFRISICAALVTQTVCYNQQLEVDSARLPVRATEDCRDSGRMMCPMVSYTVAGLGSSVLTRMLASMSW